MHKKVAAILAILASHSVPSSACSYMPGHVTSDPLVALRRSEVVVHVRVMSQVIEDESRGSSDRFGIAQVNVLRSFKGRLSSTEIETGRSSMCGMGPLKVGQEYVLFFTFNDGQLVRGDQPYGLSAAQILNALSRSAASSSPTR